MTTLPDQHEKLAKACHVDEPGTALDRWRASCVGMLFHRLVGNGRDVTVIVGKRTDRKKGQFNVVLAEETN